MKGPAKFTEIIGDYSITYTRWNDHREPVGFYDLKAACLTGLGGFFMPNAGRLFEARNWVHKKLSGLKNV